MSNQITLLQVDGKALKIIQLMSCLTCIEKVKRHCDPAFYTNPLRSRSPGATTWTVDEEQSKLQLHMPPTLYDAEKLIEEGWTLCSLYSPLDRARFVKNTPITPTQWERLKRGLKRTKSFKEPCELCYKGVVWVYNGDPFGGKAAVWAVKTLTDLETLSLTRRNHVSSRKWRWHE